MKSKFFFSAVLFQAALFLFPLNVTAQKTLQDLVTLDDKKFDKLVSTKGTPFADQIKMFKKQGTLKPEHIKPLKKVGIISIYIADYSEVKSSSNAYMTVTTYKNLSKAGANKMVDVFYASGLVSMRNSFKEKGIELLIPSEFANTPEKKSIYNEYEMEISKFVNKVGNLGYLGLGDIFYPNDFRMIWATKADGIDTKQQRSLGKLAKDLELGAIIAIEVATQIDGKNINFKGIGITMFGPNPIPFDPEAKYPGIMGAQGYWEGRNYGYVRLNMSKDIAICKLKKKEIVEDYSEGGAAVVNRTLNYLMDLVQEKMVWPE
ncbi:MAG: hypothetical protein HKN22_08550 [Bacteroidia bacterium]|nr:hypothetical protein [Bacteroidia bacterium]